MPVGIENRIVIFAFSSAIGPLRFGRK